MSLKPRRKLGDFATLANGALLRVYAWRTNEVDCHGYCRAHPECGYTRIGHRRYACGVIVRPAPATIAERVRRGVMTVNEARRACGVAPA